MPTFITSCGAPGLIKAIGSILNVSKEDAGFIEWRISLIINSLDNLRKNLGITDGLSEKELLKERRGEEMR